MASVHFFRYYCRCGEYLFDNSHIVANNSFCNRNYISIERKRDLKIYIQGTNNVRCEICNTALGGMIYGWYTRKPDLIRFVGHKVMRQKIEILIHRETESNQYDIQLHFGELISRRYQN